MIDVFLLSNSLEPEPTRMPQAHGSTKDDKAKHLTYVNFQSNGKQSKLEKCECSRPVHAPICSITIERGVPSLQATTSDHKHNDIKSCTRLIHMP